MAKKQTVTMSELLERLEDFNMAMNCCDIVAKARIDGKPFGKMQWGKFKDKMGIVANFRDVADTDLVNTDM